jgi:hypothetical protein
LGIVVTVVRCLFLWIADLLHLEMLATEQHTKIKVCVLLYKSPSETLQILEEAYGTEEMKKA